MYIYVLNEIEQDLYALTLLDGWRYTKKIVYDKEGLGGQSNFTTIFSALACASRGIGYHEGIDSVITCSYKNYIDEMLYNAIEYDKYYTFKGGDYMAVDSKLIQTATVTLGDVARYYSITDWAYNNNGSSAINNFKVLC